MAGAHDTKPAVAIAGPGDLAKFFIEELARDVQYRIVILSRTVSAIASTKSPQHAQI